MDYSELSKSITKTLGKDVKKNNGIFFTPPKTISTILDVIHSYIVQHNLEVNTIMEPSCGSGEFVSALNTYQTFYSNTRIIANEYNKYIFNQLKTHNFDNENIEFVNEDFIKMNCEEYKKKTDLIVGNPPYFVMKKSAVPKEFYKYYTGRPNIFILFIIKALGLLSENGILAFVLPTSFLNCVYYDKTRKYIAKHFKVINILKCNDSYLETKQETVTLILQNTPNKNELKDNPHFIFSPDEYTIFGTKDDIQQLKALYEGSTTLNKLGFVVNVGNVVWNQCKDILTNDSTQTRLIYSSDIKNNKLILKEYSNPEKKNYIMKKGSQEPLLVINRGYGVGKYKFDYLLIEGGFEYLIENHLICIRSVQNYDNETLISLYKKIIKALTHPKTTKFIQLYFGNSAMNTSELCNILPLHDI